MTPAEGMRAHLDLQGGEPTGVMLPIHWATFNLTAAAEVGARVAVPLPGEPFEPTADDVPKTPWWRAVAPAPATAPAPAAAPASASVRPDVAGAAPGTRAPDSGAIPGSGAGAPETAQTA
ncbi:hypothetical protein [Streptomyces sp. NPDC059909]|uniref:hypothetical protein n=1 Tax=Streptomyces sp. NPDC059909 TaxID=3346998 RepID=UPI00366891C4